MSSVSTAPEIVDPAKEVAANLRKSFVKGLIIPAVVLVFFWCAPAWLNQRIHAGIYKDIDASAALNPTEKSERRAVFAEIDFAELTWDAPIGLEGLRDQMAEAGIIGQFQRLSLGFGLSVLLVATLLAFNAATLGLNRRARRSREDLIKAYRLGWRLGLGAALTKVFLLIPLMSYGLFELTTLAFDRYYPQAILAIVIGGLIALWRAGGILLRKVPLEFTENMAREVKPEDAPSLWSAVREAAAKMKTEPPDRILVGMQRNFYVTELAVNHDGGRAEGRTLFLSQPMMKQLAPDEVMAIIGHELGHFIGEDTRVTREFYPLRFKTHATLFALAQSGWVGWPSVHALNFFSWCFGSSEQAMSREREFEADRAAARLTGPETAARALVRFHVVNEAYEMGITGADGRRLENPYGASLAEFIRERLLPRDAFWVQLFEKRSPHPLDSHPPLRDRLESLGRPMSVEDAKAVAATGGGTAYALWFEGRDDLFVSLVEKVDAEVGKLRNQLDVANATYETQEGRDLLDAHFPEVSWSIRPFAFWLMIGLWGLAAAGSSLGIILSEGWPVKLCFAVPVGLMLAGLAGTWKRHRRGVFTLRADSLNYTGWKRPLRFADVRDVSALNQNGSISVTFRLKDRAPCIWRCSPLKYGRKSVAVSLGSIRGKQQENLRTLYRYYTRQIEPVGGND